jgi:hypothetical protein
VLLTLILAQRTSLYYFPLMILLVKGSALWVKINLTLYILKRCSTERTSNPKRMCDSHEVMVNLRPKPYCCNRTHVRTRNKGIIFRFTIYPQQSLNTQLKLRIWSNLLTQGTCSFLSFIHRLFPSVIAVNMTILFLSVTFI